jgi:hypothetical protein
MFSIKFAVNRIEGILESGPYVWLMLPPKENAVHYEYAYFHMYVEKMLYLHSFLPPAPQGLREF